ncbi:MAG: GTPase Era [Pseudomonadota bacterium]
MKCGYVAILGRPNVGKSTLMNHLLGQKIAITSRKPQTTRHNLLGIDTVGEVQALYVDTPGIHETQGARAINRYMVRTAASVLQDVDLLLFLIEQGRWTDEDQLVLDMLARVGKPLIAVITKIDQLARREDLLPIIADLRERHDFAEIFPIAALRGDGVDELRTLVGRYLPAAPHLFEADQITDRSERFLVAEVIREKLMRRLGEELPHQTTVVIESFARRDASGPTASERADEGLVDIAALIYVERAGQRQIVIGRKGERLKAIGQDARKDIQTLIGCKVMLRLWVKVRPGWTDDERSLSQLGYDDRSA